LQHDETQKNRNTCSGHQTRILGVIETGIRHLLNAVDYSFSGFSSAFRNEDAFR
jgi:diacylglycerol kinase (ATP)